MNTSNYKSALIFSIVIILDLLLIAAILIHSKLQIVTFLKNVLNN